MWATKAIIDDWHFLDTPLPPETLTHWPSDKPPRLLCCPQPNSALMVTDLMCCQRGLKQVSGRHYSHLVSTCIHADCIAAGSRPRAGEQEAAWQAWRECRVSRRKPRIMVSTLVVTWSRGVWLWPCYCTR